MKQIFQDLKTGETRLAEVPRPSAGPGQMLMRSHASLVSAGTERMLVEFGRAGWVDKARTVPPLDLFWKYRIMCTYFLPVRSAARPGRGYLF